MEFISTDQLTEYINGFVEITGFIITIAIAIAIVLIVCIIGMSLDTRKLTKQMDFLSKQVDYLIQLEERRQSINSNPQNVLQNVQQNIPKKFDNSGFDNRQ